MERRFLRAFQVEFVFSVAVWFPTVPHDLNHWPVVSGPSQNRTWSVTPSGSQWSPSHRFRIKIMDDAHSRHPRRHYRPVARPSHRALLTAPVKPFEQKL